MSFFCGGHFEFSKSAILKFFCFISVKNPALLYEVSFFSALWMVFPESWKRSCPNFYAHDCKYSLFLTFEGWNSRIKYLLHFGTAHVLYLMNEYSTCFAFYFNHLLYLSYCRFRAKFVVTYKSMFVQFSTPWTFLRIYLLQKLSNCKECLKETEKKILNKSLTPDLTFALTPKNVKVNNVKWPANFSYGLLPLFNLCLPYTRHYNPLLIINRGFQAQISLFST